MGSSRLAGVTALFALFHAAQARAEPAVAQLPPVSTLQQPSAVPIEIRGSEPGLRLEVQDPKTRSPLAYCQNACQASIVPGRYRLFVGAAPGLRAGGRDVQISGPSRLLVTPRSDARYTTGLVLGIAGPVLSLVGSVVLLSNLSIDGSRGSDSGDNAVAGLLMMVTGIAITPVGWVMFGTSFKPKIEVTPLAR